MSAPPPAGHYSPGVVHNGFVFVSGQLPMVPGRTEHVIGTIEEQTEQCLRNVERVLQAAGSALDRVVQMTVYISDGDLWGRVNAAYVIGTSTTVDVSGVDASKLDDATFKAAEEKAKKRVSKRGEGEE